MADLSDVIAEWLTNSNECFHINLVRPAGAKDKQKRILEEPFHPSFTYEIFGNEEKIIGYKDPKIYLDFRANDLKPTIDLQFKHKMCMDEFFPKDNTQELDMEKALRKFVAPNAFDSTETSKPTGPDPTSSSWKPPGELLQGFKLHGKQFEIWKTSLADVVAKELYRNMQVLVPLFIEGGSLLELDDPDWTIERWTLFLLYEVTPLKNPSTSPYTIAGFCTTYRLWVFPTFEIMHATKSLPSPPASSNGDATSCNPPRLTQDPETYLINEHIDPLQSPSRERISQFVVLPPFQGQSLGARLYESVYQCLLKTPNIYEITVEDPSEAFDAMRDYSDIVFLRTLPAFNALSLPSTLPPETLRKDAPIPRELILGSDTNLTALRHEAKMVPRQFNRMVELHLLSTIPLLNRNTARITRKEKSSGENDRKFYFWRLALKDRIYRQNADQLDATEDVEERIHAVEGGVNNQQEEYNERLEGIEKRARRNPVESEENSERSKGKRKRAVIIEDDEDDEDIDVASIASSKKVKA
ncbi:histone acetyltransferase type B [Lindgomyces ingoldianus]|uniref:Histone acetyltransferase type B n=1 Tax=Lindgomyces ingoldianus TaxID=673940 RepID=A0ACB6RED1_9PLEO|nr:histone acetyltransferase type B [Lindgomyces ingoldianus]KAF2477405.1 histone acetyltransferase type B [Lindgomyces ingoldianus]